MLWGAPYSLLLLLGAIPAILFLHSLRPKGDRVRTAVLFILERVLREQPVGKRLGWLMKKNLLLLLQILIALFLIMALADPSLIGFGNPVGDIVVVVDLSASMKAGEGSGSRFKAARKEFLSLIDAKPSSQRIMVIGAGPSPRVLLPFTSDNRRIARLIRSLHPTDAPAQVKEAILFAHSFLRQDSDDRVVVFSDAAFEGIEEIAWNSPHLRLVRVEGGDQNVGIMAFEFRQVPADPNEYEIMVSIKNFTNRSIRAPLTLKIGERTLVSEVVEIGAQGKRILIYPYRGPLKGRATALLGVEDDFLTDNSAFLVLSGSPVIRVLYAGKGNFFLEQLLRSFPHVRTTHVDRLDDESFSQQVRQYDVIVLDGIASPTIAEGNFILINTVGKGLPLKVEGKVTRPRPVPWTERHSLANGLRLENLYIGEALKLVPLGEGVILARSKETPLIYALETDSLKALVFAFDLLDSDLPLRLSFPLLLSNAFEWFRPGSAEFPAAQVQAGTTQTLHVKEVYDQVEIRTPSGLTEKIREISRNLDFPNTLEAGFYTFKGGNIEGQFAVNLFSEAESQIRSSFSLPSKATASGVRGGGEKIKVGFSLWPYLLFLVFLLLAVEGFLVYHSGGSFTHLLFRLPALLAVLVALVNPSVFKATNALDVVLAVDFSRSVGQAGKDEAVRILDEAQRLKGPKTRLGLLSFSRRPVWEFFPRKDFPASDFFPPADRRETDITAALQAALAQINEEHEGRVLLVSDGNENRGEVSRVLPLLRSNGIQVWTLPVSFSQGRNEIYLRDFVVPHRVDSAETFEVRGAIESLREATARVKLLRDGVVRKELQMVLRAGTNWVSFRDALTKRGSHTFELLVESPQDTLAENNLLEGVIEVQGPPRVLYLHSLDDSQRVMARVLSVQGYEVVEASADQANLSLPELSGYDLLVLDNLPAYGLSQAKMEAMEHYVRDLGGGLLVIGGTKSYGAGGYYRSPLERVLPVEMRPPARLELPHVALLFILDKSGSMGEGPRGATKVDLAKAAAIASAELLSPTDQVGVLAFDAGWEWIVPFTRVGKGEWISDRISSLQADGGTDLYNAMVEGYRSLFAKKASVKHVLVLSDGLTDKKDFSTLVKTMAGDGVTVSTVSVGRDADLTLMGRIAKNGKGRGYLTIDPRTIPQIFTTETLLISQDLLVEKTVQPKPLRADGPLEGLSQKEIPPVRGYVLTHPKPLAEVLMKVEDNPLLVTWRYGLGRVVAFTSDLSGRWGRDWLKWERFPQWSSQLARSVMRRVSEDRVRTELRQDGEEMEAQVDFISTGGRFINHLSLRGILTGPDRTARERAFRQVAPGRYEARFSAPQRGIYLLTIYDQRREGEEPSVAMTVPFISPYPKEYREVKPNTALLSRLAEETGGEVLESERLEEGLKRLFTPKRNYGRSAQDTWWALAGLGLLFFLADLALRRLPGRGMTHPTV